MLQRSLQAASPPMSVPPIASPSSMTQNSGWGLSLSTERGPFPTSRPSSLEELSLLVVRQGAGWMERGMSRIAIGVGSCVVLPPAADARLVDDPSQPLVLEELRVSSRVLEVAALDPELLPNGVVALDADRASRIAGLMRRVEIERKRDLPHSCALATSLTLRLLADLAAEGQPTSSPAPAQGRPWYQGDSMARVRAYVQDLEQHFFEATNLDAAAASLGLSRRRFTQLFRQCTDSSWLAYVRRLRIEHAKRLLAEPQKTVLSIAFECGFEDLSTFYRAFKREVGVSPNQWRQS